MMLVTAQHSLPFRLKCGIRCIPHGGSQLTMLHFEVASPEPFRFCLTVIVSELAAGCREELAV